VRNKVEGIWVSIHSLLQLDISPSSFYALPKVVNVRRPARPDNHILFDRRTRRVLTFSKLLLLV